MILLAAVFGGFAVIQSDINPAIGTGGLVLGIAGLIWLLERRFPAREDWQPTARLFGLDLLHTLVSSHGIAPFVRAGLVVLGVWISTLVGANELTIWPHDWPLFAQLLLAIPIADFCVYWAHRLMHMTELGWRIHAVHHTPTRLYFMASARTHPLNAIVAVGCQFGVLLLLGVGPEVMTLWTVFMAVNGLLQHSNINFKPGILNRVLATCDVHRAHHALEEAHCNFGNNTMIWDQIFGTYRSPPKVAVDVGAGGYEIPENYLAHLTVPFKLQSFEETKRAERSDDD